MPHPRRIRLLALLFWGGLFAGPAHAHILSLNIDDFYLGLLHPLTALEHIFPMLALGALAAQQGTRKGGGMLTLFLAALVAGLALGAKHNPTSMAIPNNLNYASFIVFGALVAAARPAPAAALLALALLFGLSHGYGNGAMLRGDMAVLRFCNGAFAAMLLLIAFGLAPVALLHSRPRFQIAVRVLGSWIAAIGLMMMALAFAGR